MCKVKVRSKVRNMCFRIIAYDWPYSPGYQHQSVQTLQNASLQQESSLEDYVA